MWVVSLGDSYISGEAGRWAGNETGGTRHIDALGRRAYWDTPTGESIPGCHRSKSAVIHIGLVNSLNLACSGATTSSAVNADGEWKPGIDFVDRGRREGQALMLAKFAEDHDVRMVALSIGGNDFHFSDIVTGCVKAFVLRAGACKDDPTVVVNVAPEAQATVQADITRSILNIATAMQRAGKSDRDWTLVMQLYPRPLPLANEFRYGQGLFEFRQAIGGCGFYNTDVTWALSEAMTVINDTVLAAGRAAEAARPSLRIRYLDTTHAYDQRELCQKAVSRVDTKGGPEDWRDSDAVDRSEWVMDINIVKTDDRVKQESLHPNYWGQLALRDCWREVWNQGEIEGGRCQRVGGVNARGEPQMRLAGNPARFVLG